MRIKKYLLATSLAFSFSFQYVHAKSGLEKRCQELQLDTQTKPAVRAYAAMKCPQGAKGLPPPAKRYFDFFSRLKEERWSDYKWKLSTDDFLAIVEAEQFGRMNRDFYLGEITGQLGRQFSQRSLTNEKDFLAYVLRSLPCSEGSDGLSFAVILGEALHRNAAQVFDIASKEELSFAANAGEASRSCRESLKKLKIIDPVAMHLVEAIKMLWPRPQMLSIEKRDQLMMQLREEKWNELLNRRVRELKIHLQNKY